jgi:hypothetical protein
MKSWRINMILILNILDNVFIIMYATLSSKFPYTAFYWLTRICAIIHKKKREWIMYFSMAKQSLIIHAPVCDWNKINMKKWFGRFFFSPVKIYTESRESPQLVKINIGWIFFDLLIYAFRTSHDKIKVSSINAIQN